MDEGWRAVSEGKTVSVGENGRGDGGLGILFFAGVWLGAWLVGKTKHFERTISE